MKPKKIRKDTSRKLHRLIDGYRHLKLQIGLLKIPDTDVTAELFKHNHILFLISVEQSRKKCMERSIFRYESESKDKISKKNKKIIEKLVIFAIIEKTMFYI